MDDTMFYFFAFLSLGGGGGRVNAEQHFFFGNEFYSGVVMK